jgi:ABC-type glycerol-3-phosphate transport system substrate-binding protein
MKKLSFLLSAAALTLMLGACSNEEASKGEEKEAAETAETADESKEVRSALLNYQGEVTKIIRSTDASLTAEGQDPAEAAAAFEKEAKAVSVPEELTDYTKDIEAAIDSLSQYFAKKAELVKAGSEDMAEAEPFKEEYINSMTKVFEEVELSPPAFKSVFQ